MDKLNAMHSKAINGRFTFWVTIRAKPTMSSVPNYPRSALYSDRAIVL